LTNNTLAFMYRFTMFTQDSCACSAMVSAVATSR
jgi:hypothetical protein